MFDYTICTCPDETLFFKQCSALEEHIPGLQKLNLLGDVDCSLTQLYQLDGQKISVHNSFYIGALYVESEIELTKFFKK